MRDSRVAGERGDDALHAHEARPLDQDRCRLRRLIERGIESLWAAGAESANTIAGFAGARAFLAVEELIAALDQAPQAASILVKGSRFMRMERVVQALCGDAGGAH